MYIDFKHYLENGGRSDIDYTAFSCAEFRAGKIIDRYTQNRVGAMVQIPEAVKRLMVELVTLEATQGAAVQDNPAVTSFSNDGYSETYAEPLTTERIQKIENDLILTYLLDEQDDNGVPLLWLGVG